MISEAKRVRNLCKHKMLREIEDSRKRESEGERLEKSFEVFLPQEIEMIRTADSRRTYTFTGPFILPSLDSPTNA